MRRLGAIAVALACAASAWGTGAAAADQVPGPGITLTRVGDWYDAVPGDLMAVDAGGTRYASTFGSPGTYRTHAPGGSWSAPRTLPRGLSTYGLHLAAGRAGTALAAYAGPSHGSERYLAAQVRRTTGSWTAPFRLSAKTVNTDFEPQALGNADGDYAVVWSERPRAGGARSQVKVGIYLRGDRWRVYPVGPGTGFIAGMDSAGAVYVTRTYTPSGGLPSLVQRTKRPGRAMSAAQSFGVVPERGWNYYVEATGRQTVVLNDDTDARVLRQETLGGPFRQVWRKEHVWAEVAVGGARLQVAWRDQDPGEAPVPSDTWTQVLRPAVKPVVALGQTTSAELAMDRFGRGIIIVRDGQLSGRTFQDGVLGGPFVIADRGSAHWHGWTAAEGHLLDVTVCTNCGLLPEEGGGPPFEFAIYATQTKG